MDRIKAFLTWLVKREGKPEKLLFKSPREAVEFVRRVYNANPEPTAELRSVFQEYQQIKKNGTDVGKPASAASD